MFWFFLKKLPCLATLPLARENARKTTARKSYFFTPHLVSRRLPTQGKLEEFCLVTMERPPHEQTAMESYIFRKSLCVIR